MKFTVQRHMFTKRRTSSQDYRTLLFPSHFTTIILNAYLQQFLLSSTLWLAIKKKLEGILKEKVKKRLFEEAEQASEPDTAETLELSDLEFKTAINYSCFNLFIWLIC